MKKTSKHALTALAALAVFTLSSCGQAAIPTETAAPPSELTAEMTKAMHLKPIPLSFSAGEQDAQDFEVEQDEASFLDTIEANNEAVVPEAQESEPRSQAGALPAQTNPEPAAQQEQQEQANDTAPVPEPTPPAAEITIVTQQPEPAPQPAPVPPAPVPEPEPAPAPAPAPAFDVSACVQNVMNYGVGIGLTLDSTATACWDNPTRANAQSLYAERDLCGLLDWYKASGFTAFWVWAEADGNGGYLVYIGYA